MSAEARGISDKVMNNLKGVLLPAMTKGGPVNAIKVCKVKAPVMAAKAGKKFKWKIARTSLKYRNPKNAPDEWETKVLNDFEDRKNKGESIAGMSRIEVFSNPDGSRKVRYMRPIPTLGACLNCHGSSLKPEVAAELDKLYPGDKARGFKPGDIRGAFTFTKKLN